MPALYPDPDNALVSRILALEAGLARVSGVRRNVPENVLAIKSGTQVIPATTTTKVTGFTPYYEYPDGDLWDSGSSTVSRDRPGIFYATATVSWSSLAAQKVLMFISETSSGYLAGAGATRNAETSDIMNLATLTQLDPGSNYGLYVYCFGAGGTLDLGTTLAFTRMGDQAPG